MPSVISVTADPREHQGRADNDGEVRYYLVEFDLKGFTLWQARNATGVPVDGEALAEGSNLVVTRKVATRKPESSKVALVEVTWSVPTRDFVIFPPDETATKWNITIEAEGISYIETVSKDRNGLPIENSALYPFDPMPTKEYFDEVIVVSYTTDAANLSNWDDDIPPARGKINSDSVTLTVDGLVRTFAEETLKMGNARYSITFGLNSAGEFEKQYRVQIPLLYRFDTWKRKIVDQGFYEFNSSSLEWEPILDANGQMVSQPVFLDGSGQKLAGGADAVLLEFDIEETIAFNPILTGL